MGTLRSAIVGTWVVALSGRIHYLPHVCCTTLQGDAYSFAVLHVAQSIQAVHKHYILIVVGVGCYYLLLHRA